MVYPSRISWTQNMDPIQSVKEHNAKILQGYIRAYKLSEGSTWDDMVEHMLYKERLYPVHKCTIDFNL